MTSKIKLSQFLKKLKRWINPKRRTAITESTNTNLATTSRAGREATIDVRTEDYENDLPKTAPISFTREYIYRRVGYESRNDHVQGLESDDSYLIDYWEETERDESDIEPLRFTVASASGTPNFVFDEPTSLRSVSNVVNFAKSKKPTPKQRYVDVKAVRRLSDYVSKLYPGLNLESLLYVRFYLAEESTMLTSYMYELDRHLICREYVDVPLMNQTMAAIFDYDEFDHEAFLHDDEFERYGQCLCFQIGYKSKVIVLSFDKGYNITLNAEDVHRIGKRQPR